MAMSQLPTDLGEFSRALVEEVAAQMTDRELTQDDIARAVGRSQPTVSLRLSGRYPWTVEELEAIAPLFGMDVFQLVAVAKKRLHSPPPREADPEGMTAEQIEQLPNSATTPRRKP